MEEWRTSRFDQLKNIGAKAYGSLKNQGPILAKGPKSSWMTGVTGKVASKANVSGKAAADKLKISKFGAGDLDKLAGVLGIFSNLYQQNRRRRKGM